MSDVVTPYYLNVNEFRQIKAPIVDLRSPTEFKKGHWPGSFNIPLFTDEERAIIGKAYKESGKEKAIFLGLSITRPKINLLKVKLNSLSNGPANSSYESLRQLRLLCWRGGMRSASVGWLTSSLSIKTIILNGGYKTYRRWVLNQFIKKWRLQQIAGKTGTGKTDLITSLANKNVPYLDLEGLANHRGSSFGGLGLPSQPTNEQYENKLAEALQVYEKIPEKKIIVEAESANLGKCRIPKDLFLQMKSAPTIEIEKSKEERIKKLVEVYGCYSKEDLIEATKRISRRLGPQRTKQALTAITESKLHIACNEILDYYDRCYKHELDKDMSRKTIDMTGLSADDGSMKIIEEGYLE